MQWNQFQQFSSVARWQNMTRAAQELSISQPALSRSIARLEEEMGFTFFERNGKKIKLNSCGAIFLEHVERAMREIEQGKEKVRQYADPSGGTIALAFLHSLGANFVPGLVERYRKSQPKTRFKLYQNGTTALREQLLGGEIDLCLCAVLREATELVWTPLYREPLFIAVPKEHWLAGRGKIKLAEIAHEPVISFKEHYGLRILADELFAGAGIRPEITFEGEEIMTVAGLVEAGLGVALIPHSHGLEEMKLVFLAVEDVACYRTIGLAWTKTRNLSPAARRFKDFILNESKKLK